MKKKDIKFKIILSIPLILSIPFFILSIINISVVIAYFIGMLVMAFAIDTHIWDEKRRN